MGSGKPGAATVGATVAAAGALRSRRLPETRHRLWGLSDADYRCRCGEREHGRVEPSTTRRRVPGRGATVGRPANKHDRKDPAHLRPQAMSLYGGPPAHPATHWTLAQASSAVKQACRKRTFPSRPGRRSLRRAAHALLQSGLLPWVAGRRRGRGWRRGLAHEPRKRRDDRGGLLLGGRGSDDRELGAPIH